jgi:hypothetical protein
MFDYQPTLSIESQQDHQANSDLQNAIHALQLHFPRPEGAAPAFPVLSKLA